MTLFIIFALALYLTPTTSYSNSFAADDAVIVQALSYPVHSSQSPGAVDIFTREDLERGQDLSLKDFLERNSSYHFSTQGAPGASSSLFLRGQDSAHVSVLVDGVMMNDPSNPNRAFDFGHLSLHSIERIEVLKGPQSILYGADALGGVISITTKKAHKNDKNTQLQITQERYNTQALSASRQDRWGELQNFFSLEYQKSDGFSSAKQALNSPITDDGRKLVSLNQRLSFKQVQLSIGFIRDSFDLDSFDEDTQLPIDAKDDQGKDRSFYSSLRWHSSTDSLNWDYTLSFKNQQRETTQADETNKFEGQNVNARLNHIYVWDQVRTLSFGLHVLLEESKKPIDKKNTNFGPYSRLRFDFGKTFYHLGLRSETHQEVGHRLDYSIGAGLYLGESTLLKYHFATGFKSPTLFQLYDPTYGNVKLEPEESLHHELSFLWTPESDLELNLAVFSTELKNRLSFEPSSFRSINRGRAAIYGSEFKLDLKNLLLNSDLSLEATVLKAYSKSTGLDLLRRPRQKYAMSLTTFWSKNIVSYLSLQQVSERFDFNDKVLNPYTNLFLGMQYQFTPSLKLSVKIDNLLNQETSDAFGYNSAKRVWGLGISSAF